MVEKIMITPEKVRGYGNIMSQKTGADFTVNDCTLIVGTDTVNGELVTVYEMQPSSTLLYVSLSVNDNSVLIGETVTLSAIVSDEMFDTVSGASVSFKLNGASIGTSTTNSSGIATYTYTCNTAGTLTFSAVCMGNNSNNVNVTVTGHNYSLTFSSTSYTTNTSGDATVSAVLTDNGTAVSGATVTFTGGTSTVTATTDSSGVATATVNFTTDGTLTATSNGVSDTCTVTFVSVIFEDYASTDNSSTLFGSTISLRNGGTGRVDYVSTSPVHYAIVNTKNQAEAFLPYSLLDGIYDQSFKLTVKSKNNSSATCPIGLYYYLDSNNWGGVKDETTNLWVSDKTSGTFHEQSYSTGLSYSTTVITEITFDSDLNTLEINQYDENNVLKKTATMNIPVTLTSNVKWGSSITWSSNSTRNVYEIKAEYI